MIMVKSKTNHNLVKRKRLEKGMSLVDLGRLVDLTQSHICKIESGERQITASRMYAFADALGVAIGDLYISVN